MIRRALFAGVGIAAASAVTYLYAVRPWWRGWGVDPVEAVEPLPGDDLVPDAPISDTRGITIDAPPAAVWPWLPQMGFGRAGWYSYDQLDMNGRSTGRLEPELQELKAGDILPTHPGGGFVVKTVDPGHALVVYVDGEIMAAQAKAAQERGEGLATAPANLRATGAFLGTAAPPTFKASWSFVVEPLGETQSRLIERFRVMWETAEGQAAPPPVVQQRLMAPMLGFGVFVMVRKQLLGIRERAEQLYREGGLEAATPAPGTAVASPSTVAGSHNGGEPVKAPGGPSQAEEPTEVVTA